MENNKYLDLTISKNLKWNTHVSNVRTKANRTLGFLRRNLSSCPPDVKEMAYKGLVRPVLEYASPVLDPRNKGLEELDKLQNSAARFETGNSNFYFFLLLCFFLLMSVRLFFLSIFLF